jgi:hypothetical protein
MIFFCSVVVWSRGEGFTFSIAETKSFTCRGALAPSYPPKCHFCFAAAPNCEIKTANHALSGLYFAPGSSFAISRPALGCVGSLGSPQHARSQEVKVRAPIHLPLDGFQAIDLAFDRTITPRIFQ